MRHTVVAFLALAAVVAGSETGSCQEGILKFAAKPPVVVVAPGGRGETRLTMTNTSPYEADEVEVLWAWPEGLTLDPAPEVVEIVGPFGSASITLAVAADSTAALGETSEDLEIIYSYCIGDLCYQIVDRTPVTLRVAAPTQAASGDGATVDEGGTKSATILWLWIAFGVAASLVGFSLLIRRTPRARAVSFPLLVVAAGASLGFGVSLDQHHQAQAIGDVLCTSCVGIESVETAPPRLSTEQEAAVDRVSQRVELLVFYAPWCRSCPYAEALVELASGRNPLVTFRLIDAEEERDLAAAHGVTRSGRTVVPAIVRLDTDRILFGAENLGDRLVKLLEEEP